MKSFSHMKIVAIISILIISYSCYSQTNTYNSKNAEKIGCNIYNEESFDTVFIMNGNSYNLICKTECNDDYTVPDTSRLGFIKLYQDRLFRFTLKSAVVDTQFIVTKELIKNQYKSHSVYLRSLLVYPRIESIDTVRKTILISAAFMYPSGLDGTDFCDDVTFYMDLNGKITLNKIKYYEPPGMD